MHVHLRDGAMLELTVPSTANTFAGALVMPNLPVPITTAPMVASYRERILSRCKDSEFTPYMTLFFRNNYTRDFLESVKGDILALKLYPKGSTTLSDMGATLPLEQSSLEVVGHLEALEIPLCVHGETSGFVMDRESEFASVYEELASSFPKLKIIMEHITTQALAELLDKKNNLYATVTLHHLTITLDDVVGGALNPHNFCKPVAKTPKDRDALRELAFRAHPKVMFGSDSAPHPKDAKEGCCGAAGIFHAPFALQALAELFESSGNIENLQKFVSDNAQSIYGITPPDKTVVLEKKEFIVPKHYAQVTPFKHGDKLTWSVREVS